MSEELCKECGLPLVECSAVAIARNECERWLRDEGYSPGRARNRAYELIPSTKRTSSDTPDGDA